jgi:putative intracellular protease/amidase
VPGGVGVNQAMEDEALLAFLRRQAGRARYVTSVSQAPSCSAPPVSMVCATTRLLLDL